MSENAAMADRPAGQATPAVGGAEPISGTGPKGERALVVEHLSKRFGDRVAFDDVSFDVGYGEVFGFLGPNGAGKTTTVRTLGTLIAPTSGSAVVAGIALSALGGLGRDRGVRALHRRARRPAAEHAR